jgi:hypothetical protein
MRSLLALLLLSGLAAAQKTTPLLEDDLQKNKRTRIDAPRDSLDADLDAALGGPQGFSTKELEKVEDRIRNELKRDRPRATPRLIVFLYPGRIDADRLKSLSEVNVDIELVMDPCERTVCREAVAKHIELVGRAVGQPVIAGPNFKMIFKTVTLKTSTTLHDEEVLVYQVPIADCVEAARKPGGGVAWLDGQAKAEQDYEPIVTRAIARHAAQKRVALNGPPSVKRSGGEVDVTLKVRGDRARTQQQTIDALAAAAAGLRDNPKTPAQASIEVNVDTGLGARRFRAPGNPVGLYLDQRLSGGDLWANYVEEVKKEGQRMAFDDGEARGGALGGDPDAPDPDDNEVIAVLSSSFGVIGGCARAEAAKNAGFRGVTVTFQWTGNGRAEKVGVKEAALRNGALARCLATAVGDLKLPRHNAAPRTIEYPIRVK